MSLQGRASRRAPALPRIDHRAVIARLIGRPHGELVNVELAEHDRAGRPQIGSHRRLIGWREAVEDVRAGRGADALGREQILDAERDAFERPRFAFGNTGVALLRRFERTLWRHQDESVQRLVRLVDGVKMGLRKLGRRQLFTVERGRASAMVRSVGSVMASTAHRLTLDETAVGLQADFVSPRLGRRHPIRRLPRARPPCGVLRDSE